MSVCEVFEEVVRAANVFARPLNNVDPEDEEGGGGFIAPGGKED